MANSIESGGAPLAENPHYIANLQKEYGFFADMQDDEIYQFLRLCHRESFKAGEEVFSEGDQADTFFLILSGEIVITAGDQEFSRLKSGYIFGEMGILEHVPRNASARAVVDSDVFSISRKILATQVPALGFKIACNIALQLSNKLRLADEQLKQMGQGQSGG